jgi:flavin reductase (DIM6/NTAB) family NADH-FMN oxidoreductase RutF
VSDLNYSFEALKRTKECVLNIPTVRLIQAAVGCGNVSGRAVDKFAKFGLTPLPARRVQAPLIAECPVNLECVVADGRFVAKYGFFVLRVVQAWRDPRPARLQTFHHLGQGHFMIAGRHRVLRSRAK